MVSADWLPDPHNQRTMLILTMNSMLVCLTIKRAEFFSKKLRGLS